jgi:hypothetical protein
VKRIPVQRQAGIRSPPSHGRRRSRNCRWFAHRLGVDC